MRRHLTKIAQFQHLVSLNTTSKIISKVLLTHFLIKNKIKQFSYFSSELIMFPLVQRYSKATEGITTTRLRTFRLQQCCPTFLTPWAAKDKNMKPRAAPSNSKVTTKIC